MEKLEAIKRFVRVAELASFTRAADQLGLPKASVSNAVQQLENQLGTQLLHRTTRKVQLTPDGQLFYERSKDLLGDIEDLANGRFQGRAGVIQVILDFCVIPTIITDHASREILLGQSRKRFGGFVDRLDDGIHRLVDAVDNPAELMVYPLRVAARPELAIDRSLGETSGFTEQSVNHPGDIAHDHHGKRHGNEDTNRQ